MFKVNDRNTTTRCETCSKLTMKTQKRCSDVFIVNVEHIWHLVLVFLLSKLVSAIFYQISFFFFSFSNDSSSNTVFFISSKKLFSFSRYPNFCEFSLPFNRFKMTYGSGIFTSWIGLHKFTDKIFGVTQNRYILHHQIWSDNT